MNIKLINQQSYKVAFGYLEGNGFCFRPRKVDRVLEFFLESAVKEAANAFNGIGLEDKFTIID